MMVAVGKVQEANYDDGYDNHIRNGIANGTMMIIMPIMIMMTSTKKTLMAIAKTLAEEKVREANHDDNIFDDVDNNTGDQFTAGRGKSPGGLFKGAENLRSFSVSYSPIR